MSAITESKPTRRWAMPDTLVIIFFVAILTSLATWVVPVGMFDSQEVQYQVDGQTKTRTVVDPHSFRILTNEAGEPEYHRVQLFSTGDERPGLMNFPFEGLTSGSKYGTAVGIIMFMLVIGGAFGIVMRTGTIDNGILALIRHTRGNEILFIPALFILFSLGGAVFGMGEEAVAFAIILLLVGNGEAGDASVLNTILNSIANAISGLDNAVAAWFMLLFQAVFNFFVTSGSGQAALTMPLLAPLGDLVGVNRQVTVLAFQFGDGFSHIIYPTSASLMATLGVCRVDFRNWLKVGATLLGLLFIMSSVVVIGAQLMGYH
ncbi:AbgT family transporter [Escherichia albertii]|nr:AbgT family transporter [Escherichia albertii]